MNLLGDCPPSATKAGDESSEDDEYDGNYASFHYGDDEGWPYNSGGNKSPIDSRIIFL